MKKKFILSAIGIFAITCFTITTVFLFKNEFKTEKLPTLGSIQPFTLIDSYGNPFTGQKLKGKVWIANFFFTTCGDICPITNGNMASLSRTYERINNVQLVSISVNPEYDTPKVLAQYAKQFNKTNLRQWHFLTGPREDIKTLAVESFKLGKIDEPVFHSSYFTLVDRNGLIRGYYDGKNKAEIDRLFKHSAQLVKAR